MAQLPEADNPNGVSIMDEIKVNPDMDPSFNDNDSLKNNFDAIDYPDDNTLHSDPLTEHRDNAPGPPSQLTMQNMQDFDHQNPPQPLMEGLMDALGGAQADIPDPLINNLLDMGFPRDKAVYALKKSHQALGMHDSAYAVSWLFENPNFIPPDTSNINATLNEYVGGDRNIDFMSITDGANTTSRNPTDDPVPPPNNSPQRSDPDVDISGIVGLGADRKHHNAVHPDAIHEMLANMGNQSKSGRVYNNSNTMASAATVGIDEEKTIQSAVYNQSDILMESKTDGIEDDYLPNSLISRPHHQATTSTVASELSAISTLSTGMNVQNGSGSKEQMGTLTEEALSRNIMNMMTAERVLMAADLKMVLVVRRDLKMSSGKVAAQCCHGCLGVAMDIVNGQHISNGNGNGNGKGTEYDLKRVMSVWRNNGEKKIVLQCQSEEELKALRDQAAIHGLPHYLVADAGHTQIKAGSITVLAIGPYLSERIDLVTKDLKLF